MFDYFNLFLFGLLMLTQVLTIVYFKYRLSIVERFRTSIIKAVDKIAIDKAISKTDDEMADYLLNVIADELTTEEKIVHSTNLLNKLHNKIKREDDATKE